MDESSLGGCAETRCESLYGQRSYARALHSAGDDGRVLLKCHAGCSVQAIVSALDLKPRDLFTVTTKAATKRIVATYDYTDEEDTLLYQAVRYEPKDFRQRRPDGKDKWTWRLGNVRRVLYCLPDIKVRLKDGEYRHQHGLPDDVFIVEGEKDVDRLWRQGLIATTNAGGAGKWREEYTQQLVDAGAKGVIILPDNDDPGRKHADDVARSCHAAGLTVRVVMLPDLPDKGDVSDWLQHPRTLENLIALVRAPVHDVQSPLPDEDVPAAADLASALTDVEMFIRKHVVLSREASALSTLWAAQTHAIEKLPRWAVGFPTMRCQF